LRRFPILYIILSKHVAKDGKRRRPLSEFFSPEELSRFGPLASKVFIVFDETLPPSLHGKSVVEGGVPLALINPRAADHRYVILHELMHHVLDELGKRLNSHAQYRKMHVDDDMLHLVVLNASQLPGCPSLWVTVRGDLPAHSWLGPSSFSIFARGPLVQLWELIQHSRFNLMLLRVFQARPTACLRACVSCVLK